MLSDCSILEGINTPNMKFLLSFCCVLCFVFNSHAQLGYDLIEKKHEPQALRKDIDLLRRTLEKHHPNLYRYASKATLSARFDSLKRSITKPMSSIAFFSNLSAVLSTIGDGHLSLSVDLFRLSQEEITKYAKLIRDPIGQFEYKVIGKRLYIFKNLSKDSTLVPGTEIVSINQVPASMIIDQLFGVITADGYNLTWKYHILNDNNVAGLYRAVYGNQDSIALEIKDDNMDKKYVPVKSYPDSTVLKQPAAKVSAVKPMLNDPEVKYLKVNSFLAASDSENDFKGFFKVCREQQTKTLILDLRGNTGGELYKAIELFTYLIDTPAYFGRRPEELIRNRIMPSLNEIRERQIKYYKETGYASLPMPQADRFKGKLYVLVNGGTFSAAALLASNLQGQKNVVFVGEETGGGRNGCTGGLFELLALPESKLNLRYGIIPFNLQKHSATEGRGLMPDVPAIYRINEFLTGKDQEMDWVMKDIKQKKPGSN